MTVPAVFGQAAPQVEASDYNATVFLIQQGILKIQTMTLVKVLACTNDGGLAASGTVDVQPLVNQMTGNRLSIPHKPLYKMPYQRVQGGSNAVILDPVKDDIGLAIFASCDISGVKSAKGQANPGSFRKFNYADGIYLGGTLNGVPSQFVQFFAGLILGASVVSTTGNLSVGTGANGVLVDLTGQTAIVQDGIIVNISP